MSVEVPFGEKPGDTATLLLAAAQELGLDASVVRTRPTKRLFIVPEEVSERAFGAREDEGEDKTGQEPKKAPAKKSAAKKAAAKKTAAKKAATNKKEGSK